MVNAADPPPSGPAMETRLAKRARQSRTGSKAGPSSSTADDDVQASRIQHLEERLDKMNQSQLEMQAQLQQTMADQARETNKLILNQQEFNKQLVDSQSNFMKMTTESIQSILISIPTMMRQYAIEAQAFNPAPLSAVAPQLLLPPVEGVVLSRAPSRVATSAQVPETVPSTPQSSDLGSQPDPRNVQKKAEVHNQQVPPPSAG